MTEYLARLRAISARAIRFLLAPATVVIVLLFAGVACAVAGVSLLYGTAWALICAAVLCFLLALLLLRGVSNG